MKIWVFLAAFGVALAQTSAPAAAPKGVIGSITALDKSAKQLTVKADNGTSYTVKLDGKTTFLRVPPGEKDLKKAAPIALADLDAGDRVSARGTVSEEDKTVLAKTVMVMTKGDLEKKHAEEAAEWQKGVVGIVSAVNPDTKEITVTPRGANPKPVVIDVSGNPGFLRYAPGSSRFDEAKPSTFADIKTGDNLRARGEKNEDGTRLKAGLVLSGSFQTIAGTVISVDPASKTVRITDLATKKPLDVVVSDETMVRRIPDQMAMMLARRFNPDAAGAGGPGGQRGPGAGGPGGPGGQRGPGAGGPPSLGAGGGQPGGQAGPGAAGGARPGGLGGGAGRGSFDLQDALVKLPPVQVSDLKAGDALIVTSTKDASSSKIQAITLVAGVEPILASAPRSAGQVNLGAWSFDGGIPTQ